MRRDGAIPQLVVGESQSPDALLVLADLGVKHFNGVVRDLVQPLATKVQCLSLVFRVLESHLDQALHGHRGRLLLRGVSVRGRRPVVIGR